MPIRIYFRVVSLQTHRCSLRIQAYRPKRALTLTVCVFQIVARADGHDDPQDDRRDGGRIGGCGVRRARPVRSARRKFVRCLARQLIRPRRFTGLAHRRRRFGVWIPRRIFPRGFGRLARCGGRNFGRLDRHLQRGLAIVGLAGEESREALPHQLPRAARIARRIIAHGSLRRLHSRRVITARTLQGSRLPDLEPA